MKIAVKNRWHSKIRNLIEDENEDLCDISFKLTDEDGHKTILKCHKFVLALASPVFKTQFYGALEVRDEEIEIKDGNAEIFRDLINFIYKEEHFEKFSNIINPEVLRDVLHLCYFAEKYQMADLLDYLHSVINHSININSNNVFLFLESIEEYNYLHREYAIIKEKCFGFIDKNVKVFFGQNSDQNASTVGNGNATFGNRNASLAKINVNVQINDTNFLEINKMYQLLSRNSFEASEFTIYKIIKAYCHIFDSPAGKKEKVDKEILLKLVNFEKMTLMEVNLVVGDDWLPKGKYDY